MSVQQLLLSPAELSYLQTSLSITPSPIRPDGRTPTQFRPLVAETGILPGTNGSARVCFADGSEAIVGVKAEVEKTATKIVCSGLLPLPASHDDKQQREGKLQLEGPVCDNDDDGTSDSDSDRRYFNDWVELAVEIPGVRDDDAGTTYVSNMLAEALLADGELIKRLCINRRFHWKMYLDVLLISQPLSYPLPLLSLTTHLALLSTRLPCLVSEGDEDPMFNDDWEASTYLYPSLSPSSSSLSSFHPPPPPPQQQQHKTSQSSPRKTRRNSADAAASRPPITLLIMTVGPNILFDPSHEELAVADAIVAVSVSSSSRSSSSSSSSDSTGKQSPRHRNLKLLSIRSIDPPSRLTAPGLPNELNPATNGEVAGVATTPGAKQQQGQQQHVESARMAEIPAAEGVWKPPRGGLARKTILEVILRALTPGGVVEEVLDGLEAVELS